MNLLFWEEFVEDVDWKALEALLAHHKFPIRIGLGTRSRNEFLYYKEELRTPHISIDLAWPLLSQKEGYWFSSFTSLKAIDQLNKYAGIPIKIDIEPLLPEVENYQKSQTYLHFWFFLMLFKKGKNRVHLEKTILSLAKHNSIMLSTFPFPLFFLKRLGIPLSKNCSYNYIFYTSFVPKPLKPLFRLYMKGFIKRRLKFDSTTHFAVGLLSPGIFKNEPCYTSPAELAEDLDFLHKQGVQNVVVFRAGSLLTVNNPQEWISVLKRAEF